MRTDETGLSDEAKRLLGTAMIASAGASAIHFAAVNEHLREWPAAGVFMFASGLGQLLWILVAAARPAPSVVAAGAAANAAVVGLWLVSRTSGLPFGPERWSPEHPHAADVVCTMLEALVVAACVMVLLRSRSRLAVRLRVPAVAGALASIWVTGHDPAREHAVALAVLLISGIAVALVSRAARPVASITLGGDHVERSLAVRLPASVDARSGAVLGARG